MYATRARTFFGGICVRLKFSLSSWISEASFGHWTVLAPTNAVQTSPAAPVSLWEAGHECGHRAVVRLWRRVRGHGTGFQWDTISYSTASSPVDGTHFVMSFIWHYMRPTDSFGAIYGCEINTWRLCTQNERGVRLHISHISLGTNTKRLVNFKTSVRCTKCFCNKEVVV